MRVPRLSLVVVCSLLSSFVIAGASCSNAAPTTAPQQAEDQQSEVQRTETVVAPETEQVAVQDTANDAAKSEVKTPVKAATPATPEEAAAALDLQTFPLPTDAQTQGPRRMAALSYTVKKPLKEVLDFNVQELTKRGWKEVAGSRREGPYAGADFTHGDFHLNLSVMQPDPTGPVNVTFARYGNVALTALPVPKGAKQVYAFPATVMYTTEAPVKETAEQCRDLMLKAGWTPYGSAGTSAYYRQNAVQAMVNVMSAPGQGGKTAITYTSSLLSLALPAFPDAIDFRYTDMTSELSFDTNSKPQAVTDYYRKALAPAGWKATTDKPVAIKWKQLTIFRKPGQQMITITTHDFEGRTRVRIKHQTAAEVAEEELLAYAEAGRKATYRKGEKPEVTVSTANSIKVQQEKPYSLRMQVKPGTAFSVGKAVVDALLGDGWSGAPPEKAPVFTTCMLKKGEAQIWVIATEPTKAAPWVSVTGAGVTLKPKDQ
ncbi:hypothetical protein [Gimesia panareensis]|uniref:hypothetical protein n=1 Tax=Gimesia panareensis TaxID=2527978 RepID=UPI00118A2F15|nr:hypothetical protein [Gimesia panareensis]QDU52713.1 hypothetical protein Pan110_50930 [Gimesia panareensis]